MPPEEARRGLTERLLLALEVARGAAHKVRPPGSLIFICGTGERRPRAGLGIASTVTVALSTLIANLAREEQAFGEAASRLLRRHFEGRPVAGRASGDHHVIDRR